MSIAGYILAFQPLVKANDATPKQSANEKFALPSLKFPLIPQVMYAGFMSGPRRVEPVPGILPLAFVGTERLSLDWLDTNKEYLAERGAKVLVISVESGKAFENLIDRYPELSIIPVPGDKQISEELLINVFPVLVDVSQGVIRQ